MSVRLRIAWRYLGAKKSHSAVTAISAVSICGVAVATAAMVCVLSVFNGFRDVLSQKLDLLSPELMVTPKEGKTIPMADSVAREVAAIKGVVAATPTLTENALALYQGREMPVTLKGVVPESYDSVSKLREITLVGEYFPEDAAAQGGGSRMFYDPDLGEYIEVEDGGTYSAALAVGVASRLGFQADNPDLLLFAPRRVGAINLANPAASFLRDSVQVASIWQAQQSDYDANMVFTDLALARRLFQYDDEATAIEIALAPGANPEKVATEVVKRVGAGYYVKDRLQQQEMNFRMIRIEKWVTFLLLAFILIVASFNVVSSLSMLVIEKQSSMSTLRALGMSRRGVGGVFFRESLLVTAVGALAGIALGVVLCLLQQHFGFIKLNGDPSRLVVTSYPVAVRVFDLLAILVPVGIVGIATALITAAFARSRTQSRVEVA